MSLVCPNNPATAPYLRADFLHCLAASWDQEHLDALKVYHPNDLPLERDFKPHKTYSTIATESYVLRSETDVVGTATIHLLHDINVWGRR